jgi:hybrid cluster-associated redox disulfide protein
MGAVLSHGFRGPSRSLRQRNVRNPALCFPTVLAERATWMNPTATDPDMTVDEIMRCWPATIRVFIRHRMLCIGCPIGVFHTVADACEAHDLDEGAFSRELLDVMRADASADGPSAFERVAFAQDTAGDHAGHAPGGEP